MNYRHIFHAGNFADVFKHVLLIALTKSFLRKDTAFCYLDTHAGIARYDLSAEAAQKNKEYEDGVMKIIQAENPPELIQEYISICSKDKSRYPGSPEIVKNFLRSQDRMILCELQQDDYQTLKKYYARDKQVAVHHQDGYQGLKAFLPPKERRGLILIDPPYEKKDEFSNLISALSMALKRFETGVYAIWYPIKDRASIERFHHEFKEKITRPFSTYELIIYPDNVPSLLNGCGMIIVNPPFQVDSQIQAILPWLQKTLTKIA